MNRILVLLCASVLCGACDRAGSDRPGSAIEGLKSIAVMPANASLIIDGNKPAVQAYSAVGTFEDGHTADITSKVAFLIADATLGGFQDALFTSGTSRGGQTAVVANAGTLAASTGLTLQLKQRFVDPQVSQNGDPATKFGGAAAAAANAPQVVYPNDGVLVPPNLGKLEFHFLPNGNYSLFELSFDNAVTDVKVYLGCTLPMSGGCIHTPDPQVWSWLAETNRGGSPLAVSLRATDGNGGPVASTTTKVGVSFGEDNIEGGLYYWKISKDGDTAIMRFDFASTETQAQKFIGTELTGGTCVGCHALSHDGTRMVAEAGGQNDGRLLLLDVAKAMPMVAFGTPAKSIFESWEATGSRYVGVYADNGATDYNLQLFDGATGTLIGPIAGTGTSDHAADHPDWSQDGQHIAYVKVGTKGTSQRMFGGAIEMVTANGPGWSPPTELVPNAPGKNQYYPAFSPDGSLIVYDVSTCANGSTGEDCDADTDPTARLFAVPTAGGTPVELALGNAGGVMDKGKKDLTTSFPKWSPFVFRRTIGEMAGRLEWLTVASKRAYGLRPQPPSNNGGDGTLLWMVAVDPDKLAAGLDPSYAGFALPFQDYTTSNHIAQWTTKVVGPIQ
jgi:hypothetical protein